MKGDLVALVLIAAMGASVAAEEPTLSQRYRSLVGAFQSAQQSYFAALRVADTGAAQRRAETRRPDIEDYARRFLELAKTNPADAAAFEALAWITTNSPHGRQTAEALELLAKNQVGDKRLGSVLQHLGASRDPAAEKLLRASLESSPHREVRAQACYSLATLMMSKGKAAAAKVSRNPGAKSQKKETDGSTDQPTESTRDEAVKLFERLAQDYGDVKVLGRKTYGDLARVGLARLRPRSGRSGAFAAGKVDSDSLPVGLELGMVAPEISGRDTDGQPMRLSGYRGRVVVLDFWGHW
jgi:ribosomal protein L12E/L44/L45/RPP1/RPP2